MVVTTRFNTAWAATRQLLLILHFSNAKASRLKLALEQYVILRTISFQLIPAIKVFRPDFSNGKAGVNYASSLKLVTPHRVKNVGNCNGTAVAIAKPMTKGVVAFGFRLGEICAQHHNWVFVGITTKATPGETTEYPGSASMPGVALHLWNGSVHVGNAKHMMMMIDLSITQRPKSVCIVRIDFNTRDVTFFVNGVEAKQSFPLSEGSAMTEGLPYFPVVNFGIQADEVEAIAENDAAFDVLFQPKRISATAMELYA